MDSLIIIKNNIKTFNGEPREEINYSSDGLRSGPYLMRNMNGEIEEEGFYIKGKLDGIYRKYRNGDLYEELTYEHGVLNGDHILYDIKYSCGNKKEYFIKEKITYVNGKKINDNNCVIL